MIRKTSMMIMTLIAAMIISGCNINEAQIKTIAQTAGTGAAVAWIAKSNPDRATMDLVVSTLNVVQSNLTAVSANTTYTEVLYPVVVSYVRSGAVADQYEPLILAASLATLQAVDVFFVMYPEWREKEALTREVANCFIIGAKNGFSLANNDPMLVNAREVASASVKVLTK